ncbi:hypothetical protein TNIN_31101 [Trichonephila inaurata madagascariensis]|uniref:Uncharacterized protein n=1 Tax=Trichonephila inaurata madagascariensis TaxID=2747483 RepID=A0A8X6IRD0_9ARAC|nr:hypothetical protein TNIN_31101 [Trichonephila inaurata madagascariensis]
MADIELIKNIVGTVGLPNLKEKSQQGEKVIPSTSGQLTTKKISKGGSPTNEKKGHNKEDRSPKGPRKYCPHFESKQFNQEEYRKQSG